MNDYPTTTRKFEHPPGAPNIAIAIARANQWSSTLHGLSARIYILIVALFLSGGVIRCFAVDSSPEIDIKTNFDAQAILSSAELATVIKLARECGILEVAEVSTYNNYHPSPFFSIRVNSVEVTQGREVSVVTATIDCDKWTSKSFRRSSKILKSAGEYWVARGGVRTNALTTFKLPQGTARVRLADSVPLPVADKIVEAFATGKIRYKEQPKNEELKGVDLSKPIGLDRDKDKYQICFSTGPWSLVWVHFTLEADTVKVLSIDVIVA